MKPERGNSITSEEGFQHHTGSRLRLRRHPARRTRTSHPPPPHLPMSSWSNLYRSAGAVLNGVEGSFYNGPCSSTSSGHPTSVYDRISSEDDVERPCCHTPLKLSNVVPIVPKSELVLIGLLTVQCEYVLFDPSGKTFVQCDLRLFLDYQVFENAEDFYDQKPAVAATAETCRVSRTPCSKAGLRSRRIPAFISNCP